jgi:hypothetical protein
MILVNEPTKVRIPRPTSLGKATRRNDDAKLDLEKWQKSDTH